MAPGTLMYAAGSPTETVWQVIPEKSLGESNRHKGHAIHTGIKNDLRPIADIKEISLELLKIGDQAEATKLLNACQEDGVFYLNLQNSDGSEDQLLRQSASIYALSKCLFDLPDEEKMKYDIDLFGDMKVNGYKPIGRNFGGIRGNKDGFESYAIAKDTILALMPAAAHHPHPSPISTNLPLLHRFTHGIAAATAAILASLSTSLGLSPVAGLHHHHRTLDRPSPDMLRLLKYHAQPPHEHGAPQAAHTDLGSLTVLFAAGDGLQRRHPRTGAWEFVAAARPGCAVVNVGDALEALSGGALRSCVHRVVPVPGRDGGGGGGGGGGMEERWSFAYMQRPEEGTLMRGLRGGVVSEKRVGEEVEDDDDVLTSEEWLKMKFAALRKKSHRVEEEWVLTGQKAR